MGRRDRRKPGGSRRRLFIANAAIGIAAAYKLFPGLLQRLATLLLGMFFVVIFCHSHILVIVVVLAMAAVTFARERMVGAAEEPG